MSGEISRIVVGLDGSSRQEQVLRVAGNLSDHYGAELVLFRSIGLPPEVPSEVQHQSGLSLADFLQQRAQLELAQCLERLTAAERARAQMKVALAVPWQGICRAAAEQHANLIVIGSHGYGGLDRLLGTTASRVLHHAPCSVLVVKDRRSE